MAAQYWNADEESDRIVALWGNFMNSAGPDSSLKSEHVLKVSHELAGADARVLAPAQLAFGLLWDELAKAKAIPRRRIKEIDKLLRDDKQNNIYRDSFYD